MKTLIIAGAYQNLAKNVNYDVVLMGQSPENPLVQVITYLNIDCNGYNDLQDICRNKYADYFKTDLFNIISIEHLTRRFSA